MINMSTRGEHPRFPGMTKTKEIMMETKLSEAPLGKQTLTVDFGGTSLQTFTYRPAGEIKGVLLSFHGSGRNAEAARDTAMRMADEKGLYVVAPLFSADEYSTSEYQRGGVATSRGELRPEEDRTVSIVDDIARWAHAQVGNDPADETIAFGHSAGAQFASRVAAFGPDIFDKIIVANASTHVRASLTEDLPYGFNGVPAAQQEAYLRDYLDDSVTIYVGSLDNDPNSPDLAKSSAAMRQGDDRLERAQFVYQEAKSLAESKGWDFNWEFVVAKGVAHSGRGMFNAPEFNDAFDGRIGTAATPIPHTPDLFVFEKRSDWHGEILEDFREGDLIDFSAIDANSSRKGNQSFDFVGPSAFTSEGAQIRVRHHDGDTYVYLNTDRDRYYEAKGMIDGIHHLTADDFIL